MRRVRLPAKPKREGERNIDVKHVCNEMRIGGLLDRRVMVMIQRGLSKKLEEIEGGVREEIWMNGLVLNF